MVQNCKAEATSPVWRLSSGYSFKEMKVLVISVPNPLTMVLVFKTQVNSSQFPL
jgi:hypothetical protein